MPGGWRSVEPTDDRVRGAVAFAVKEMAQRDGVAAAAGGLELVSVSDARMQVVAGINLSFRVRVRSAGGSEREYVAVVYDRFGSMSLTQLTPV